MSNKFYQSGRHMSRWIQKGIELIRRAAARKENGIDGILVTVGLCIIALLLCVMMKDSLTDFIETIVQAMTEKANLILTGPTA